MNIKRIKHAEEQVQRLRARRQLVRVVFRDGTVQTLPALSVIDLLHSAEAENIVDITGESNPGSGRLLELLRGLVVEVP